jgi:hypothetical protein
MNGKENIEKEKRGLANVAKEIPSSIRDYINTYITLADAKAGFLLGIAMGLLATTYVNGPQIFKTNHKIWALSEISALVGSICLILAICFAVVVVFPKTPTSRKKGLFSWAHIANYKDEREYLQNLSSASEGQITEGLFQLNYSLSTACKRKYVWLSRAFKMGFAGFIICTAVLAFFSK